MDRLFAILGFAGAFLILLAYYHVSHKDWPVRSKQFQGCNALGAGLLIAYSLHVRAYPNVLLNFVWVLVALWALRKTRR